MSDVVLDSSAVLALLLGEPGADAVRNTLPGARLSTINLAEVISKLCERHVPVEAARAAVEMIGLDIVNFDSDQAYQTGDLRRLTKQAGLSLGDRACLALARSSGTPAMTADAAWKTLRGFDVILIRAL